MELPGSQVLWSCITTACAHDHHCHVLTHTPLTLILPLHSGVCRTLVLLGKTKVTQSCVML